eukprot:1752944-Pleurochrysis_carterae.AAC.1
MRKCGRASSRADGRAQTSAHERAHLECVLTISGDTERDYGGSKRGRGEEGGRQSEGTKGVGREGGRRRQGDRASECGGGLCATASAATLFLDRSQLRQGGPVETRALSENYLHKATSLRNGASSTEYFSVIHPLPMRCSITPHASACRAGSMPPSPRRW